MPWLSLILSPSTAPPPQLRLLEVAAGTGRFHTFIKDTWPSMRTVVSDLSPFYLAKARENVRYWARLRRNVSSVGDSSSSGSSGSARGAWRGDVDGCGVEYLQTAAEKIDAPDGSFDVVGPCMSSVGLCTCIVRC